MGKGKNILMELTEKELQRKIERITQEIQEAKEEGLKVDMATTIYKAATLTLDEDLESQMKRNKDVERKTEGLRENLDMLRLKLQERKAREARINSETAALLAKGVSLDKELTEKMEEFATMREGMAALKKKNKAFHRNLMGKEYPAYEQGAANSGPDNCHPEVTEEDDGKEIVYKPPFLSLLKGGD
ncbi:hypothetical protein EJD97_018335 [Solanum chilense]|uniref:Uncharacterized protein n=1 Tax=Solanum chilense TaxID=4083 RepID=A0A6N2B1B1_SOLCI|nr:hypothetical protein EJD97_018335 [Solanum chilense]